MFIVNSHNMRYWSFLLLALIVSAGAQAPAPPSRDNAKYYGFGYGAVGIAEVMLDLLSISNDARVERILDSAINSVIVGNTDLYWSKTTEDMVYWTGYKYGQEGYARFFLDLFERNGDNSYLELVGELLNQRIVQLSNQENRTFWGYDYINTTTAIGISLTGRDYGAASVIETALNYYEITRNESALELAEDSASWMIGLRNGSLTYPLNLAIPWYDVKGFKPVYISSFARGISGILPQFLRLSQVTGNESYYDIFTDLVEYLVASQNDDGSWFIDTSADNPLAGLDEGTAGVLLSLSRYARDLPGVNASIDRGLKYIENFISNSNNIGYQFTDGLAGILFVLNSINYTGSVLKQVEEKFISNFVTFRNDKGEFILYNSDEQDNVYELSFKSGLAGALSVLLQVDPDSELIGPILNSFEIFGENGLWPRQVEVSPKLLVDGSKVSSTVILMVALVGILVILLIYKRMSNRA